MAVPSDFSKQKPNWYFGKDLKESRAQSAIVNRIKRVKSTAMQRKMEQSKNPAQIMTITHHVLKSTDDGLCKLNDNNGGDKFF